MLGLIHAPDPLTLPRRAVGAALRRWGPDVPMVDSVPEGRMVELPGRGRTFVVDVPGPRPDAPTVVLLHAMGTTAYLSWFGAFAELARDYRVIALDQRWHGRGIHGDRFRIADCADDVSALLDELGLEQAVLAGYSMGCAVAQETWHRHPERVAGLVLCSFARNMRGLPSERLYFTALSLATHPLARIAAHRLERLAQRTPGLPSVDTSDVRAWGWEQLASTSVWSVPEVLAEIGRFDSSAWIGGVDVPTAVVVTARDGAVPPRRQRRLADAIPGARVVEVEGGHAALVLDRATWLPAFLDVLAEVVDEAGSRASLAG